MSINRELDKDAIQDLTFTFTRNVPKSVRDEMEMYLQAGGQVSQQTLMSLVSFIDNPQQEMERIENEEKENDQLEYPTNDLKEVDDK